MVSVPSSLVASPPVLWRLARDGDSRMRSGIGSLRISAIAERLFQMPSTIEVTFAIQPPITFWDKWRWRFLYFVMGKRKQVIDEMYNRIVIVPCKN